jgi:hypothetical protein
MFNQCEYPNSCIIIMLRIGRRWHRVPGSDPLSACLRTPITTEQTSASQIDFCSIETLPSDKPQSVNLRQILNTFLNVLVLYCVI